ncbi:hypothetical protein MES5069_270194 [Mesorhizobium escarrei]|uniref:Transposase n=1 Tax=Mesorhizobium escarrei TaxID=666018 RepID=A0ABM9DW81_9HYPH|nr:hypothetical protein MES5069_270194 [Mesorhizobium escarrei]
MRTEAGELPLAPSSKLDRVDPITLLVHALRLHKYVSFVAKCMSVVSVSAPSNPSCNRRCRVSVLR